MSVSLAEVLARFGPRYLAAHGLSRAQAKAWRAIAACRTSALGGQQLACDGCGATQWRWHSCRNRHCPRCQKQAADAWRRARSAELLEVPYAHLVFTLPHELNALARAHPRWVYETLFGCAAATLNEFAANPRWLGGRPSFTLVLHTWTQDLRLHIHAHVLMACGALAAVGERQRRMQRLTEKDWVVYAKTPLAGPAAVLDYLARYTHRTAIGHERIVAVRDDAVRLRVRGDGGGKKTVRIDGAEFVGRFVQHVLPAGFKRIRHYGLLAPAHKTRCLAQARAALAMPAPNPIAQDSVAAFMQRVAGIDLERCPHCQGRWRSIALLAPQRTTTWPRPGSAQRSAAAQTAAQPQAP